MAAAALSADVVGDEAEAADAAIVADVGGRTDEFPSLRTQSG